MQLVRANFQWDISNVMLGWLHANPSKIGFNVPFTLQVNFRGICMESSEHTIAYISPLTWSNKMSFNKQTVFILFFPKSNFCDVTLLYSKQVLQTNTVALEHSHWPLSRVLTHVINMMAKYLQNLEWAESRENLHCLSLSCNTKPGNWEQRRLWIKVSVYIDDLIFSPI